MFNPLVGDLSQLKDADLEAKLSDLNKKYGIALRIGNGSMAKQIQSVIESIRFENSRRHEEASRKLRQAQNKDLDGLINVG